MAAPPAGRRVRIGAAELDVDARRLLDESGQEIPLTASEFDLLKVFSERRDAPAFQLLPRCNLTGRALPHLLDFG